MNKIISKYLVSFVICVISLFMIMFCLSSCRRLIEVEPPIQAIVDKEIFSNNVTASSVVTGILSDMSNTSIFSGKPSITIAMGLSSDEMATENNDGSVWEKFYKNSLDKDDAGIWLSFYSFIYRVNAAIEGIEGSSGIAPVVKKHLLGEAKFLRGLYYFYLVNLYGDVPLVLSKDILQNKSPYRISSTEIYEQIIKDLLFAQENLESDYLSANLQSSTADRLRPNRFAAASLLARVYLYAQQWENAEQESSKVIGNDFYTIESVENTFGMGSKEVIWQLQSVVGGLNTLDANTFVLASGNGLPAGPDPNSRPVVMNLALLNSFEANDSRKLNWTDTVTANGVLYAYPLKYKAWEFGAPVTEHLVVLRLAEQYLIRAEARANLGRLNGPNSAGEDLNVIRNRAGLPSLILEDGDEALLQILEERRLELFAEFGHRWLDLKRREDFNIRMQTIATEKGAVWNETRGLFPIPVSEIQRNPSLRGHQNPGYPEQ